MSSRVVARWDADGGAAGDMALGALLGAGAPEAAVRSQLAALGVRGWRLTVSTVERCGMRATRAAVDCEAQHHHRHYSDIRVLLDRAELSDGTRQRAHAVFAVLAEAEGTVHGIPPERVHFHEVGAVDAIVDIVGTCAALDALGVIDATCGPVTTGSGTVVAEHGALPVPAPAVVEILRTHRIPWSPGEAAFERCTPTGAAILAATCSSFGLVTTPMVTTAVGYGAGAAAPPGDPNVLRVQLGEPTDDHEDGSRPRTTSTTARPVAAVGG